MKITKLLILTALILCGLFSAIGLAKDFPSPLQNGESTSNVLDSFLESENFGLTKFLTSSPSDNLLPPQAGRPDVVWMRGGQYQESLQMMYSPDGQFIATFVKPGSGADLRIYRASDGMMLRTIQVATYDANSFAFSPDSQTIVVGAADNINSTVSWFLKYVRLSDGIITHTFPLNWAVARLTVSPNGQYIAISDGSHTNGLWRFSDGSFLRHFATYYGGGGIAFSPDSQYVAAHTQNPSNFQQTLALFAVAGNTGDQPIKFIRGVGGAEFSPNGQLLAVNNGGGISVFNIACEPNCTPAFQFGGGGVLNAVFSPDGQKLAASMVHGTATEVTRIYNTSNWSLLRTFNSPRTSLPWVSFAPDSEKLVIGTIQPNIWNANDGSLVRRLGYFQDRTVSVAMSSDGQILAAGNAGSHTNKIQLFNAADGSLRNIDFPQSLSRSITNIGFADNNQKIITTDGGNYSIWNAVDGSLISDTLVTGSEITLKISPDGQYFVIGTTAQAFYARLYRVSDNALIRTFIGQGGADIPLAFSPDGQSLATIGANVGVRLWRISDGTVIRNFSDNGANSTHGAFSPDGQFFAAGLWNNNQQADVKLWRVSDGVLVRTMTGHTNRIETVAFTPDGQTIVSSATDNTIRFWRALDGVSLQIYDQETRFQFATAGQIVFSPNGSRFAYGRADASVVMARNPFTTYLISGQITRNGSALSGVSVALTGASSANTTTDASGNYSFAGLTSGGNYTVTPTLANNTFTPPSASFTNLTSNQTANFTAALNCTYSLSPPSPQSVGAAASVLTVTITAPAGCAWTAASNSAFITVTGGANGNGNGAVNISIAANTGASRTGTLTIAGQPYTINQNGTTPCQNGISVSLPSQNASQNATVTLPITVGDTTGRSITAFDFDLRFDPAIVRPLAAQPTDNAGTLSANFTITPNANTPGRLVVSAFGVSPLSGAGTLLNLKFEVIGTPQQVAALMWQTFQFNEGDPCAATSPGQITVVNGSIAGTINYHFVPAGGTPRAMANVTVTGAGTPQVSAATNASGAYLLNNFGSGAYTVTPSKTGDVNGISSLDASRVAQFAAGLVTLTANQQIAADTTNNGSVSSLDASRLAQYVAGIPNTGITGQWKFAPASRNYTSVTTQMTGENYEAILVGEVTGNWTAPAVLSADKDGVQTEVEGKAETQPASALPPVTVSLPTQNVQPGATITIPVTVGDTTGQNITAYDFDLRFDPNVIQPVAGNPVSNASTLSSNFTITPNPNNPGRLVVSAFGIAPLAGSGTLLNINFQVVGQSGSSPLTWQTFVFNEGDPAVTLTNGSVTIPSACSYTLSQASANVGASGGAGSFTVTAAAGCAWTAASNATWLTTSSSGTGGGTVNYTVAANTGAARSATITVGGQTFTVNQAAVTTVRRSPFDFDGDNKTDVSIFRPSAGEWWYLKSSDGGNRAVQFGTSTDKLAPADFTGDGKTDIAFFRPSNGFWYVVRSEDSSYFAFPFGADGDVPVPADYDRDGKADAAVYRPSTGTWFILNSSGAATTIINFGLNGDKPVPADYDGDGKADIGVLRPSDGTWWHLRSSDNQTRVFRFGAASDKPVQGDYTGDGRADVAVYRPSTGEWFIMRSEDNSFFSFVWGQSGDVPAPGDYDGDGKTDAAVFRPTGSTWFMNQTTAGVSILNFGSVGDVPVPSAFIQ